MNYSDIYIDGAIDPRRLYAEKFNGLADEYVWKLPLKHTVNFGELDSTSICSIVRDVLEGNVDIYTTLTSAPKEKSSCISDDADILAELNYRHDGAYACGGYVNPGFIAVDNVFSMVVAVTEDSFLVLYDHEVMSTPMIRKIVDSIYNKLPLLNSDDVEPSTIKLINYANGSFYTSDAEIMSTTVNLESNYNDDFKDAYDDLVSFLSKDFRHSGVAILHGEPGCGKTMLLKHLMTNIPNKYIYMGISEASHMASPDFKAFLMEHQNCVFIIEDCEALLQDRSSSSLGGTLSGVLNMSDGILSDIFNAKFICTYNGDSQIDEAILRPGRCFVEYEFRKLDADKSDALLDKLGKHRPDGQTGPMTLAEIYNIKEGSSQKSRKRKIGF